MKEQEDEKNADSSQITADRIAFLVDGEAYYSAFRDTARRARRSLLIVGWDVDSRLQLRRDEVDDGYPVQLGDFLNRLAEESPELHIHVLVWDFAMLYALEREWLPIYKLGWQSHRRLHFYMDDHHPVGASQHQKIVVADDRVAFVGGFDLSKWRWDTPEHSADEAGRVDPNGHPYPPFHDLMMLVSGPVARRLGELVRERWRLATGKSLSPPSPRNEDDPWPQQVAPELQNCPLRIAVTLPEHNSQSARREVEQAYLDAIARAERHIYIENQYLTSRKIADALLQRLEEKDGPEVVIVLPLRTGGWLEQHTMDVLRDRLLDDLYEGDKHDRLRISYPLIPGTQAQFVQVHSKLMTVDDDWLTIGSANLSNRSMGLDSECNLIIDAPRDEEHRHAIVEFRNRLLAEHLGRRNEEIRELLAKQDSLVNLIDQSRENVRRLEHLPPQTPAEVDALIPDDQLLDPEKPIKIDQMAELFVHEEEIKPARGRLMAGAGILIAMVALAALWRWTELGDWLTLERMQGFMTAFAEMPGTPLLVIAVFVIAGLVSIPLTLLVVVSVLSFGPWEGGIYAHIGATLSAATGYAIGNWLGRSTVRRFAGSWVNRLSRRLARRGIIAVVVLRMVPVAPFSVINMVAGASHIRLRHFLIGTLIGLLPGIIALAAFTDGLQRTLQRPAGENFIWLSVIALAIVSGAWLIRKGLASQEMRRSES